MSWGNILKNLEKLLVEILELDILPQKSYLAGGTAAYLYFKHRISVDLDFFTPSIFNSEVFVSKLRNCFNDVYIELMEKDTVILYISKKKIKFSLFYFPYILLAKIHSYPLFKNIICPLVSLADLEAMKSIAISQRGSIKDFVDLYFLLNKTGHGFNDILKLVINKYSVDKGYEYQLKTSFVYFDDAANEYDSIVMVKDNKRYEEMKEKEWKEIKRFFTGFIK